MHEFQITPHIGIGPILLGASRDQVQAALGGVGFPLKFGRRAKDFFCENSIQVEFGEDECADFIGCSCHSAYKLTFCGVSVFELSAPELFSLIAQKDASGVHTYNDKGYRFPKQIVTLWEADTQYDRLGGRQRPVWAVVGLGNQRYLDAIRAIEAHNSESLLWPPGLSENEKTETP